MENFIINGTLLTIFLIIALAAFTTIATAMTVGTLAIVAVYTVAKIRYRNEPASAVTSYDN